jgi:hypothetical protein
VLPEIVSRVARQEYRSENGKYEALKHSSVTFLRIVPVELVEDTIPVKVGDELQALHSLKLDRPIGHTEAESEKREPGTVQPANIDGCCGARTIHRFMRCG